MATAETVRKIALSLPGAVERPAWDLVTFRVPKGIFASLPPDGTTMGFRFPKEERAEMLAAEPDKYFVQPGHDDRYNWLRVRLAEVTEAELTSIVVDSWRQLAGKKLLAEYEAP